MYIEDYKAYTQQLSELNCVYALTVQSYKRHTVSTCLPSEETLCKADRPVRSEVDSDSSISNSRTAVNQ